MKELISITLLLSFALIGFTQEQPNTNKPYLRVTPFGKLKKYYFTPDTDTIKTKRNLMNYSRNVKTGPKPLYSHDVAIGKVYTMPYDNMPCLVPDKRKLAPMPCAIPNTISPMPNATPLYPDSTMRRRK